MEINGVEFWENVGDRRSPVVRFAPENAQVQRSLFINGDPLSVKKVWEAATALLGYATLADDAGAGVLSKRWLSRKVPASFRAEVMPDNLEGADYLYCTSIPQGEPWGAPVGVEQLRSVYEWYKLQTVWDALSYDVKFDGEVLGVEGPLIGKPDEGDALRRGWLNTRYVTKTIEPGSQVLSMRQGLMKWGNPVEIGPGEAIHEGWPMQVARLQINYVWHAVPYPAIPFVAIQQRLNSINLDHFDGYPQYTLLFADAKLRPYRSAMGQRVADLMYRMSYRPNRDPVNNVYWGHNAILRVQGGKRRYWPVTTDGFLPSLATLNTAFDMVDFASLFRPDQPT